MEKNQPINSWIAWIRACALVAVVILGYATNIAAQWTTSANSPNNINNTNTGNVGIGTASPTVRLDVRSAGANAAIRSVNESIGVRGLITEQHSSNIAGAIFVGLKSRGTFIAPTPVSTGDFGSFLTGQWYDGVNYVQSGAIGFSVDGPVSAGVVPTRLSFITSLTSGDGPTGHGAERMAILSNGNVGIGNPTPTFKLDVQGGKINSSDGLCIAGICKSDWSQIGSSSQWTTGGSGAISYSGGNVGIATTAIPAERLEVNGNLKLSGTGNLTAAGTIEGFNIKAKYQDVAEWVDSSQSLSAGTVVVLDSDNSNHVIASTQSYDVRVAGVISLQPGLTLGEGGDGRVLVATTGRVKVRVDAGKGPIQIGDLLVTSDIQGVAMKSQPVNVGGVALHRPGTLIGKALEPWAKGTGEILVLLSLQ